MHKLSSLKSTSFDLFPSLALVLWPNHIYDLILRGEKFFDKVEICNKILLKHQINKWLPFLYMVIKQSELFD